MSMNLQKQTFSTAPEYFIAGTAEIVTDVKTAAAALKKGAPVVLDADGKLAAITATTTGTGENATTTVTTTGLYGLMAEDAAKDEEGIVYLSGEFFAAALDLPDGVTAADVEAPLRNIGIYLK